MVLGLETRERWLLDSAIANKPGMLLAAAGRVWMTQVWHLLGLSVKLDFQLFEPLLRSVQLLSQVLPLGHQDFLLGGGGGGEPLLLLILLLALTT